jgi:levansucrase
VTTPLWTRTHVAALVDDSATYTPIIDDAGMPPLVAGFDFWDLWPVRHADGAIAPVCGGHVWTGLSAPASGPPGDRHDLARIRLVMEGSDLGPLFPDGASAGSREWAGSLVFDPDNDRISAYYTAAGVRGEASKTFRQRIMGASALVHCQAGRPQITG